MTRTENEDGSQQTERTLNANVKLYYDLYLPPDDDAALLPRPLLVALHGYGASKRQMMREARLLAPASFAIASLQGLHQHWREPREAGAPLRFGFGWLTNFHPEEAIATHQRALTDLIAALTSEGLIDRSRVFLLGFSQSCALNYRFAFTYTETLRGVVGICGGLPGDWETSELYHQTEAPVLHLRGTRDEFYPPARVADYEARLRVRARDVLVKDYDAGHELMPAMREDVRAWLTKQAAA